MSATWELHPNLDAYLTKTKTGTLFTTPNQRWVPEFAVAHGEILAYADGRWGRHEYSRWPQGYSYDCLHLACIPRQPSLAHGPSTALWHTLTPGDWQRDDCGVAGVGLIATELVEELGAEALAAIKHFFACPQDREKWVKKGLSLITCLRHVLDRLRILPAPQGVSIALAAHVQRLIFELAGLRILLDTVLPRIESHGNYASDVLDVVGCHTSDPATAEVLYRAGIPIWFQQPLSSRLSIYGVVTKTDIPDDFSQVPAYPRLVLAEKDISGVLNTAGVWARAMNALLRRQLCASSLPELSKKRNSTHRSQHPCDNESKHSAKTSITGASLRAFVMNPFRQFYPSRNVCIAESWSNALRRAGPLPQPTSSVTFYYPPPWLLDSLIGYDSNPGKIARQLHHLASIRTFCRLRLFDPTVAGHPLTSAEWRDALHGDYHPDAHTTGADSTPQSRMAARHDSRANIRRLFGGLASLPSYDPSATPMFAGKLVSHDTVLTDDDVQRRLVWESHEINWRCELLALDALEVGSKHWSEMERWTRETDVSRVWGPHTSGIDIAPSPDADMMQYRWCSSGDDGWEACRVHLQAFLDILSRWPGCPAQLYDQFSKAIYCTATEYNHLMDCAISFYVSTFVRRYQRLPIPPVRGVRPASS
ncbi:hypothetical protein C2E23DRAFT_870840 [Lenzites betulinus]|nr:hypothetical protein C2E23DRAFT_870840 [Lenzites betulinus]